MEEMSLTKMKKKVLDERLKWVRDRLLFEIREASQTLKSLEREVSGMKSPTINTPGVLQNAGRIELLAGRLHELTYIRDLHETDDDQIE